MIGFFFVFLTTVTSLKVHIAASGNERSHLSLDANDSNDAIQNQSNSVVRVIRALQTYHILNLMLLFSQFQIVEDGGIYFVWTEHLFLNIKW